MAIGIRWKWKDWGIGFYAGGSSWTGLCCLEANATIGPLHCYVLYEWGEYKEEAL